jgi:Nineteen complex-related protein 2
LSEEEGGGSRITRKTNYVKQAASNSLLKRSWSPSTTLEQAAPRSGHDDDRPSYNKDYLNELRNSTPSTPRDLSSYTSEDDEPPKGVDVLTKFGTINEDVDTSIIPTEAEIREKKERRARLAKEQDFISLERDGDGSYMQLSTRKQPKESRLVRDDEDLAEGFDDYVEDSGRVALGRKAKAKQQSKERDAMRDMIADAENISDEDNSEAERNLAYETTQTRNAMDGLGLGEERNDTQSRAPTIITPIPRLSSVLERLRSNISSLEYTRAKLSKQMADLQREKAEIAVREVEIQRLLTEAGEKYEQLHAESKANDLNPGGSKVKTERGLETMGNT